MAAELYIYGVIGEDFGDEGVTASGVRDELKEIDKDDDILMRINTPGGDVFEASAIMSLLNGRKVSAYVDGVAASAGSYLLTIADHVTMAEGAMLMMHSPWTAVVGPASEMRAAAETLDKVEDNLVKAYTEASGVWPAEFVRDALNSETWLTADEAIEAGFASEIAERRAAAWHIPTGFKYRNVPKGRMETGEGPTLSEKAKRRHLTMLARGRVRFAEREIDRRLDRIYNPAS